MSKIDLRHITWEMNDNNAFVKAGDIEVIPRLLLDQCIRYAHHKYKVTGDRAYIQMAMYMLHMLHVFEGDDNEKR